MKYISKISKNQQLHILHISIVPIMAFMPIWKHQKSFFRSSYLYSRFYSGSYCLVGFKKEEVRRGYGDDN